ncbi:NADPH-dependent FMN reductase [Roseateles sp. DAIF2]|uniref:NADPH-dependent FMN reductase n=1 Tax=Roseateles sp. DAIF2 TaxID=2714952 RepID=UPI0018A2D288|nr:NADPH-dependent FMN reductase [Roseateles sp. DAIF2]QPF76294.1 NADPH-dependent FMN reductase [Roseateles sp. DAIF2]
MSLLLIAASPSASSRSASLLAGAGERLKHLGLATRTLSLRELPAEALLQARADAPGLREALQQVREARVVVLATPIYKAAYSGLLKVFLDLLPQDGFKGKLVWPLATAGSPAHLLAIDYALRPVIAALGAREVVDPVFAADTQLPRSAGGEYLLTDEILRRLSDGAARVFERAPQLLVEAERCSA